MSWPLGSAPRSTVPVCQAPNNRRKPLQAIRSSGRIAVGFALCCTRRVSGQGWTMQGVRSGFSFALLFALLAIGDAGGAWAQDMPPLPAPLTPAPAVEANPAPAPEAKPASPSAEAAIPPVPAASTPIAKPADAPHVVALAHPRPAPHRSAKFAALVRRLTATHTRSTAARHDHESTTTRHVALRPPQRSLPPGMSLPPPGFYGPAPYQQLVYAGPPP